MATTNQQILPSAGAYEAPRFDVLGKLTDLAEGQGENGQLIVMQTGGGIPGGGGTGGGGSTVF